ncbi:hypothetical protein BCR32DRAFT_330098 [Anaeromyces robustus]|uniref:Swi5-domain-containing protein n=1 Tax=Anaeromyces robustus TaxID=1754192 RepID=A0A1Y1WCK3_9FUNG|nr:hypothetical protein BCR32DRAFT_330098 [Anaeromyces robustus]|eukprot:ORX71058.1 hypothetical protein BCR32DRAFT_330098 [Anaeromyces robustus]
MELSDGSLSLLDNLKSTYHGRPISLAEIQNLKNYTENSLNELKEKDIINIIIKEEYQVIWLTPKGIDINVQELLKKKEEEQEKIKINAEIEELKQKLLDMGEIDKNYEEYLPEYEEYINLLHNYNEVKDAGQILMGRLAELEGTTTKSIYSEYNMDLED